MFSLSTEAEELPEDVYNNRDATTAMRNNLHKSHVGCCCVPAKVRFRQLAYNHHLNTFRLFTWSTRAKRCSTLSRI